jgi:catechol 2,3-dioxygenase-like lactoylglutathione lyase family enzyme
MPVQRLNHAVLSVRDVGRSVAFYADALGFRTVTAGATRGGIGVSVLP